MKKTVFSILSILLMSAILLASCNAPEESGSNGSDAHHFSSASAGSGEASITTSSSEASNGAQEESTDTSSVGMESDDTDSTETSSAPEDPSADEPSTGSGSTDSNSNGNTSSDGSANSNNEVSNTGSNHRHQYSKIVVPPTCQEQGYTKYICDTCRDNYVNDYTAKVDHLMGLDGFIDPTDTTRGKTISSCYYGCGTTYVEESYSYNEYAQLLVPYVLDVLNEYRAKEGAPAVKLSNAQTRYSQYRAKQLTTNFAHDPKDSHKAAEVTHVGVYYSSYTNQESGKFVEEHWIGQFYGEVIHKGGIQPTQTVKSGKALQDDLQKVARTIIEKFWQSKAHKDILAEKTDFQIYVGIGVYKGHVCINLDIGNQDDTGYTHYWYKDGIKILGEHMCMEYVKDGAPRFECILPDHK